MGHDTKCSFAGCMELALFEGILRDFPSACNIHKSVTPNYATISWEAPILQLLKQRHIKGFRSFLKALFNRNKYCRHLCHAELGDTCIE